MNELEPQINVPTPSAEAHGPSHLIADTIGQLMEFWGFKHIMGRTWAMLFLSPKPLTAPELTERLQVSTGAVSMALRDLADWGAVRKVCPPQSRKDHYVAEDNIWKLVSRVLSEREIHRIETALEDMQQALTTLERERALSNLGNPEEIRFQINRLEELRKLGQLANRLLKLLIVSAKVDVTPIRRFFERGNKEEKLEVPNL